MGWGNRGEGSRVGDRGGQGRYREVVEIEQLTGWGGDSIGSCGTGI